MGVSNHIKEPGFGGVTVIEAVGEFGTHTRAAKLIIQHMLLNIGEFKVCTCGILALLFSAIYLQRRSSPLALFFTYIMSLFGHRRKSMFSSRIKFLPSSLPFLFSPFLFLSSFSFSFLTLVLSLFIFFRKASDPKFKKEKLTIPFLVSH